MDFKKSVGFSVLVHMGLLMIRPPEGAVPQRNALMNPIQITYMNLPAASEKPQKEVSPVRMERIHEEPAPGLPAPVSIQPPPKLPTPIDTIRPNPSEERPQKNPELKFDLAPPPPLPKGAVNLSESQFDLVRYKRMIRQHLKNRLLYPAEPIEGTVHVRIVVDPAGLLRQVMVLQASDSRLAEMAVEGIRAAAPYPRFPSGLKDPQADYEFLVQYRLD